MTAQEWLCRSCLLTFLRGCGVLVSGEVQSNKGRADLVEVKMLPHTAEEALRQILDNDYAKPYPNAKILGISIDGEKRQIVEWK
jgi:hypothetical protein